MASREPIVSLPKTSRKKIFGVIGLAIFTFSFLANVNTTPQLAKFGLGSIVLFLGAIFLFLGPTAMASAEMGAGWPRTGGIYVWTRMAFGEAAGFVIIWLEWANFVVAWPGIMGTITLQSTYVVAPGLNENPIFVISVVIFVTWATAGIAMRGLKVASAFAWWSVVAGTVIPAVLIVTAAIVYLMNGNPPAMEVSWGALVPDLNLGDIGFISGALLMFSGIEISAIHAGDVRNPGRTIPLASAIAVLLCFLLFAPLTLALAVVLPSKDINIVTGLIQSAQQMFGRVDMNWLTLVLTFCVVTGLIAALVQIINGPSRGLLIAGRQGGNLPPILQKENARKMPVTIILVQAVLSSVLALGYAFLGSVQNAWFMFALIQTNMVLIMYLMMFASVIKLRYSHRDVERPYQIPGKWVGLWVVTGLGMLVCIMGILISFSPTEEAAGMPTIVYVLVLLVGTGGFAAAPFVFWLFRKPSWSANAIPEDADIDVEAVS